MPCAGNLFEALFGPKIGLKKFRLAPQKKNGGLDPPKWFLPPGMGPIWAQKKQGKMKKRGPRPPPKCIKNLVVFETNSGPILGPIWVHFRTQIGPKMGQKFDPNFNHRIFKNH